MKTTEAVNKTMMTMIGKLKAESPLPATYLYENESQRKVLNTLILYDCVKEQKIPHTILKLITLTEKGERLGDLLAQIEEMFPPVETTNQSTEQETDDEEEEESVSEIVQASLEDIVNDG